jgi:hypothetical protein
VQHRQLAGGCSPWLLLWTEAVTQTSLKTGPSIGRGPTVVGCAGPATSLGRGGQRERNSALLSHRCARSRYSHLCATASIRCEHFEGRSAGFSLGRAAQAAARWRGLAHRWREHATPSPRLGLVLLVPKRPSGGRRGGHAYRCQKGRSHVWGARTLRLEHGPIRARHWGIVRNRPRDCSSRRRRGLVGLRRGSGPCRRRRPSRGFG